MLNRLIVFSGNSNPLLAARVCSTLGVPQGRALVGRFSDGEVRVEISENVRGMDVYVIQSTCPPVNENLVELLVLIDALKRASARRINTVIPYYGYGRQDQKDKPRVSITGKMVADLISEAGSNRIISINLHAEQIEGFFRIPVDHLLGTEILIDEIRKGLHGGETVVAPDAGGVVRARVFAGRLNVNLAMLDHRGTRSQPHSKIVGEVRGRRVFILDDMVDTGRTLVRAAEAAQEAGAASVEACCVHAILSGDAVERLEASPLKSLLVTDTVPLSEEAAACPKIRTVSIAPMLSEAVRRIHLEESVSSLFS